MTKVSMYCSGIRPELWTRFKNLESNKVDFEIIFAGDVRPEYPLPPYMKHIYTTVKPAQCYYIAGLQSQGDYMLNIADDMTLSDNGFLDNLLKMLREHNESNTIITPRYRKHPQNFHGVKNQVLLAVGSFCSRKLWEKYPIDKNFVSLYWDVDIVMSNYQNGGKMLICEQSTTYDDKPSTSHRQYGDDELFYKLWTRLCEDGGLATRNKRLLDRENLVNSPDLLVKSQGNKGRWE